MRTDGIQAIAFDAYGTLFDVFSIGALADEMFPGQGKALATLWRDKQLEYARVRTMCGRYADFWTVTGDALAYVLDRLELHNDERTRARLLHQYERLSAHEGDLAAVRRLKQLGLPLAILSNGSEAMLTSAVEAAGMDGLFDQLISVDRVKKIKTAPEAYQLGPDAFGCSADKILFVSSNGWDVCGATWFGYTTFWINRLGLPPERLGVEPTATGRTMGDLLSFVEAAVQG